MLDMAIEHGKEHRRKYRGAKAVDRSCRNHGSCPYCSDGRTARNVAKEKAAGKAIREYIGEDHD